MPNYYEDNRTIGYWFDEDNGISQHYGIFHLMDILRDSGTYTTAEGNPIEVWLQPNEPVEGEDPTYNGIAYAELDAMYLSRSGSKILREFYLERWANKALSVRTIAINKILRMYAPKWLRLWETLFYDYNPIENYNMVEEALQDKTTLSFGKHTDYVGTEKNTSDITSQIKAFDASSTWKDSDKQNVINTIEYGPNGNDRYDENSGQDISEHKYKFTRTGNIGVTTSQQMIEQQRKLVMFNYFDSLVFPDIDKVLTLQVY